MADFTMCAVSSHKWFQNYSYLKNTFFLLLGINLLETIKCHSSKTGLEAAIAKLFSQCLTYFFFCICKKLSGSLNRIETFRLSVVVIWVNHLNRNAVQDLFNIIIRRIYVYCVLLHNNHDVSCLEAKLKRESENKKKKKISHF